VYADTCSFTLTALSPNKNLWDAIPRDIDSIRHARPEIIKSYCQRLAEQAQAFSNELRELMHKRKLIVLPQIRSEVQGQRGRTHGLRLRASRRFPHAPTNLVQNSLSFQLAAHDVGLAARAPNEEHVLVQAIMKRLSAYWREMDARHGQFGASVTDKLLFATAAANAIRIENGSESYGTVALVSRDFNHVYRMYRSREEILRPVCKKMRLLMPSNFIFRPTFQDIESAKTNQPRVAVPLAIAR
jgi:hypothetical protein